MMLLLSFLTSTRVFFSNRNLCCGITGYECKSNWHCFEVDSIRNESVNISTDLGVYYDCHCLYYYTNELLK